MFNLKSVLFSSSVFGREDFLKDIGHHPKVQAAANRVTLDVFGNHDYYGHLYIGKEYVENRMIYDTMS